MLIKVSVCEECIPCVKCGMYHLADVECPDISSQESGQKSVESNSKDGEDDMNTNKGDSI